MIVVGVPADPTPDVVHCGAHDPSDPRRVEHACDGQSAEQLEASIREDCTILEEIQEIIVKM